MSSLTVKISVSTKTELEFCNEEELYQVFLAKEMQTSREERRVLCS